MKIAALLLAVILSGCSAQDWQGAALVGGILAVGAAGIIAEDAAIRRANRPVVCTSSGLGHSVTTVCY